jgi:hypothetical protein
MTKRKTLFIGCIFFMVTLFLTSPAAAFPDTKNHWARNTIDWAERINIVKGYEDGSFKPDNHVSEAEFLTMLIRAYAGSPATIQRGGHWADQFYNIASIYNFPVSGYNSSQARDTLIDRTKVAEIITGIRGYNYTGRDAVLYLLIVGIAQGKDPHNITVRGFDGDAYLTRAEAVQFIKNAMEAGIMNIQVRPKEPSRPLPHYGDNERVIPNPGNIHVKPTPPRDNVTRTPVGGTPATSLQNTVSRTVDNFGSKIDTTTRVSRDVVNRVKSYPFVGERGNTTRQGNIAMGDYIQRQASINQSNYILENAGGHIEKMLGTSDWVFTPVPEAFYRSPVLAHIYGDDSLRGILRVRFSNANNLFNLKPNVWYEGDVETGWFRGAYLTNNPEDRKVRLELKVIMPLGEWREVK